MSENCSLFEAQTTVDLFSLNIASLRNKKKLAAMNREIHGDHPMKIQAKNTISFRIQEDYITVMSKNKVTKKLSQVFSQTESRILFASSQVDDFLLAPQSLARSGSVPETSQSLSGEKTWNEWRRFPEWFSFLSENHFEPFLTGLMPRLDLLHGNKCSPRNPLQLPRDSSGKQEEARFTSWPQFRSEKPLSQ